MSTSRSSRGRGNHPSALPNIIQAGELPSPGLGSSDLKERITEEPRPLTFVAESCKCNSSEQPAITKSNIPLTDFTPTEVQKARIDRIKQLLDAPQPKNYAALSESLAELSRAVRQEVSARLEPAIREEVQTMPHNDLAEKQTMARWVNGELRHHGLAIRWTEKIKDGNGTDARSYPAILVTDPGNHPKSGRFQLYCKTEEGKVLKPLSTPNLTVLLPALELMVDDPDRRRWGKWTDLATRNSPGQTHS